MQADGLLGGEHEFDPYFGSWASFNPHRIIPEQQVLEEVVPQSFTQKGIGSMLRKEAEKGYGNALLKQNNTKNITHRKFDSFNHAWLFGLMNAGKEGAVAEVAKQPDPNDFYIERNNAVYKTRKPIFFDMSDPKYHSTDKLLPDASIWLKMMASTFSSGVPKIDENDRKFGKRLRTLQAGVYFIELYELFNLCAQQEKSGDLVVNIKGMFVDPKLMNLRLSEMYQKVLEKGNGSGKISRSLQQSMIEQAYITTRRASMDMRVTVHQFNQYNYKESLFSRKDLNTSNMSATIQMKATRIESFAPVTTFNNNSGVSGASGDTETHHILYHSSPGMAQLTSAMDYVRERYCECFIELENRPEPLYKPLNKNIASLHLVEYMSDQGMQPVSAYWQHLSPYTRAYANESLRQEDLALYGNKAQTEEHLLMMTRSSLRRHGLSEATFIKSVENHYDPANNATNCDGLFITALKAAGDVGTFAGNSANYTADFRFKDVGDVDPNGKMRHIKRESLDSFDSNILNGMGNSDDCEGMDNISSPILLVFGYGRYDLNGEWETPLMKAMKKVVDNSVIFDVGATVTSAYVDNNNKPINLRELKRNLPTIGDALDRSSHCDGHCYSFMAPRAVVNEMLLNGDIDKQVVKKLEVSTKQRYLDTPILVLEGTGSIESTVLPIDEVYSHDSCRDARLQARAAFNFMRMLRAKVTDKEAPALFKEMAEMFTGEGGEYYIEEQPRDRRISTFYREVNSIVPVQLYPLDATFMQLNFAKRDTNGRFVYGVNMGELLRSGKDSIHKKSEVSLLSPFNGHADELLRKAVPSMASITNQMPVMAFANYKKEEYGTRIYSRFLAGQRHTQTTVEKMLASVATDPSLAVIRLQSREWKLTNADKFSKLEEFLASQNGVICHGFFSEKHIPNCDALVDILLVVKTAIYSEYHV